MDWKTRIAKDNFTDSIHAIHSIVLGHLILVLLFTCADVQNLLNHPNVHACLLTGISFLIFRYMYDWKSQLNNGLLLFFYLIICAAEFYFAGIPGYRVNYGYGGYEVSKGILFDLFVWGLPTMYALLRIGLSFAILSLIWYRHKLQGLGVEE